MQSDMSQREIEELLKERIGLNPSSIGPRAVLRAIKKGLRQSEAGSLADYRRQIEDSPELLNALIESVVVPETSFFRNRVSFGFLRQWIADQWKPQIASCAQRPLRVLSLPCSTGEEPYSIAITLLEEGLSLDKFHIDAVDISSVALEKARTGVFSPYAFRRRTYRKDDKYFSLAVPAEDATDGLAPYDPTSLTAELTSQYSRRKPVRYVLCDRVREKVVFQQGNVLDKTLLADAPPYDIVFCRNMLIYFDRTARDRTFGFLDRVLRPEGLLFVGYAEMGLVSTDAYQPVPYPQTFAFYKRPRSVQSSPPVEQSKTNRAGEKALEQPSTTSSHLSLSSQMKPGTSSRPQAVANRLQAVLPVIKTINGAATSGQHGRSDLEMAQELADRDSLVQATELCDRYLAAHPSSAEAHLLRGELYQATGDETSAIDCFSRAVYLNPQMREALTHLLIIQEGRGELDKAEVVRARLQRLGCS